ncbi:EsaB/YukD family protein [Kitasatospora sp. NPDC059577]|uniref:EsaB/YukD family protein n=1 Tax=unclassified Kitasatospora TaxID=2633591 RepID=UPI0036BCC521
MTVLTTLSAGSAVRRLTIVGPHGLVELALPVAVPITRLLPMVLRYVAGPEAGERTWVLRHPGGPELDPEGTPLSLGLADGDVLHLLPASVD